MPLCKLNWDEECTPSQSNLSRHLLAPQWIGHSPKTMGSGWSALTDPWAPNGGLQAINQSLRIILLELTICSDQGMAPSRPSENSANCIILVMETREIPVHRTCIDQSHLGHKVAPPNHQNHKRRNHRVNTTAHKLDQQPHLLIPEHKEHRKTNKQAIKQSHKRNLQVLQTPH